MTEQDTHKCKCGRSLTGLSICVGCDLNTGACFCPLLSTMHDVIGKPCPVCDFIRCECAPMLGCTECVCDSRGVSECGIHAAVSEETDRIVAAAERQKETRMDTIENLLIKARNGEKLTEREQIQFDAWEATCSHGDRIALLNRMLNRRTEAAEPDEIPPAPERPTVGYFRPKPIVKAAIQLTEHSIFEVYSFIHGEPDISSVIAAGKWEDYKRIVQREGLKLMTLESVGQTQTADMGDWIVRGVEGEFHPVKPHIFEKTYEVCNERS